MPNFDGVPHRKELVDTKEQVRDIRPYVEELIALAHNDIEYTYRAEEVDPLERRDYHNLTHTKGVEDKTTIILNTIKNNSSVEITERDVMLGRLIASHHDIDQSQKEPNIISEKMGEKEFQKEIRVRYTVKIEQNSAGILVGRMEQINEREKKKIFTESDSTIATEAIEATIPGFGKITAGYDLEGKPIEFGTILQPNLKEDASIITYAVALADLGAMIDGGEEFLKDGNRVFREDNIDIARALKDPAELQKEGRKEFICSRILGWYKMQVSFVKGREILFKKHLIDLKERKGVSPEAILAIEKLFNFKDAIDAAETRLEDPKNKKKSFEELVLAMGYKLPNV